MKSRLSVILLYTQKRNIKILNLCKISIYARNVAKKIYKIHFYDKKLLNLRNRTDLKIYFSFRKGLHKLFTIVFRK